MKVLIVNHSYPPHPGRGSAASVQDLAEELIKRDVEVVVANARGTDETVTRSLAGVKVYDLPHEPTPLKALDEVIAFERPDIVHTVSIMAFSVRAWQIARHHKIPIVHGLCEYFLLCRRQTLFSGGRICRHLCLGCDTDAAGRREASGQVDAVVAVSRHTLQRHLDLDFFPNARQKKVIYTGIDAPVRAAHSARDGEPLRLGFLGKIEPAKGIFWLLSTLARLDDKRWTLKIGGTGRKHVMQDLHKTAATMNIEYLEWVDPFAFLAGIDLLVVPSLWEDPMPRVAIEAIVSGVPVLVSKHGGLGEMAALCPDAVFAFDPAGPNTFVTLLQKFIDAPERARELRQKCVVAANHFSRSTTCEEHLRVYTAAAESR